VTNLADHFQAHPSDQRVVRFGRSAFENVPALLDNLLRNYELYSAANAEGADLFSEIAARNFSDAFGDSSHFRVAFYSDLPPLLRPSFKFTRIDTLSVDADRPLIASALR
jgi:hypothetical protein